MKSSCDNHEENRRKTHDRSQPELHHIHKSFGCLNIIHLRMHPVFVFDLEQLARKCYFTCLPFEGLVHADRRL